MSERKWTFVDEPSRVLTGVEAEIAEAQECEPWVYAIASIPELGVSQHYDDRQPEHAAEIRKAFTLFASSPELYEALLFAPPQLTSPPSSAQQTRCERRWSLLWPSIARREKRMHADTARTWN